MDSISFFNTAFVICLSGTILFFIISVILFFLFDIRTIFMIRSGRAQAKTVREMQAANADTGRLRVGKTTQSAHVKKKKVERQTSVNQAQPADAPYSDAPKQTGYDAVLPAPQNDYEEYADVTEQLDQYADTMEETYYPIEDSERDDAQRSAAETSVLSQMDSYPNDPPIWNGDRSDIYFDIVKKIIIRDTDEIIR